MAIACYNLLFANMTFEVCVAHMACYLLKLLKRWVMVLACGMFFHQSATADPEIDLYRAAVKVGSQTAAERARAASDGLRQVLVRVSGTQDIHQSPEVLNSLSKATSYMDQFHYESVTDKFGNAGERLVMAFSPAVVERILRDASLPFWPVNRPDVLVWLVEDKANAGKTLLNEAPSEVLAALQSAARERGVPLALPLLDLDDQLAINAEQVWTLNEDAILNASERYNADTVLVGRVTETSTGEWWATWQFFHRGQDRVFDVRADTAVQLGKQAIGPLADYLSGLYSIVPNAESAPQVAVQISQVGDFKAYRGVFDYFDQLAFLTSYNLVSVVGNNLLFYMQVNGTMDQLNNALLVDGKIQPEATQASPQAPWIAVPRGTLDNPLRFEWTSRR